MSKPEIPESVKLVSSIFANDRSLFADVVRRMSEKFGDTDFISEYMPFDYTEYYMKEMGSSLVRRFISFEDLINPQELPHVKLFTNELEDSLSEGGKRRVNIDPGYISMAHLILATGKKYTHRPYLENGIYADLTLIYRNGTFEPLEWTYPDYSGEKIIKMLAEIRQRYLAQLAEMKRGAKKK
jgi:hypothetical protein